MPCTVFFFVFVLTSVCRYINDTITSRVYKSVAMQCVVASDVAIIINASNFLNLE